MKKILFCGMLLINSLYIVAQNTDTIYIQADGVKLHAVLTTPDNISSGPLTIIIAGSGPTDLNGNQRGMYINNLKYLSDELVANKIATLRYDKRAIGKSSIPGINEADMTIDKLANDIVPIINFCKERGYSDIYIIGHSEGSLIGMMAIQNNEIKGFISIAGAGSPADEIIKSQLRPQLPPDLFSQAEAIIDSLINGKPVLYVPRDLYMLFRPSVQPYLISWFKQNPVELMNTLKCPVLIIQGDNDLQVKVEESEKLEKASKNGESLVIKNMNHIFKTVNGDMQENMATYMNPELPVNQDLVKGIVTFINKNQ